MMGFLNFRGKKNDGQKKKTSSMIKQVMQVFNPKKAAADYYTEPKKKKSNRHPKNKSKNKKYK